jgi:hypothetical protein
MLEGRSNSGGWLVVAVAVVALVAFTGLLYVRGANGPSIPLSGSAPTARPSTSPAPSPRASGSGGASGSPRASGTKSAAPGTTAGSTVAPTAVVAGATSRPSVTPSPTPTRTPKPSVSPSASDNTTQGAGYNLPTSPQAASVALENGAGGCAGFPTGGVTVETKFSLSNGRLTATSPSNHRLSGRVGADGSFAMSGTSPVERWVGTLTRTGGSGSYFVITNGCTERYETTIQFHP